MPSLPSSLLAILESHQWLMDSDLVQSSIQRAAEVEQLIPSRVLDHRVEMVREAESIYAEYEPMIEEANRYSHEAMQVLEDCFGRTSDPDPTPRTRELHSPSQNLALPEPAKPHQQPRPEIEILKGSDLSELIAELEQIQRSDHKMVFLLVPSETKCPDPFLKLVQDGQWSLYVQNGRNDGSGLIPFDAQLATGNAKPDIYLGPALSRKKRLMIRLLGDHGAFGPASLKNHEYLSAVSKGGFTENTLKKTSTALKKAGLIQTQRHPGGGCWLTPMGRTYYESMKSANP